MAANNLSTVSQLTDKVLLTLKKTICMNQSTDEIALIMGINRNSVNVVRSRMRKNMELPKEKSLDEVLKQYLT